MKLVLRNGVITITVPEAVDSALELSEGQRSEEFGGAG